MARWHRFLPLIALTAVLAACGAQEPTAQPEPAEPSPEEEQQEQEQEQESADRGSDEMEPTEPAPEEQDMAEREGGEEAPGGERAPASGLEEEIDLALEDASSSTGVSREDITVTSAERVTWNDGSLGCPDADGMYTQALVEGYRIILSIDGRERAYHGQDGQEPFHCANPQERSGGGTVDR